MKKQLLTLAAASALMLASCGGAGNNGAVGNSDSSAVVEASDTEADNNISWKFQKPSTDIAKEIWDKYYKKKNNNADISSIQNVICDYGDVETVEYDDGGMVNIFKRTKIACFQHNDGYWHVVELRTEFCSDGCDEEYTLKHFKYQNGKLTEITSTEGLYKGMEEDPSYFYNPECAPSYLILSGSSPKAFNWDGSKFIVADPTIAQFITEEDLFKKVVAENPQLKGKKIDIGFSSDYAEWEGFTVDGTNFSYGRYKLKEGGYAIYLRAKKDEGKAIVYKYTFINGKLKYVSDKDFFKEIGDPDAAGKDINFTSNPYFQGLNVGRDNFSWNGETWEKGQSYDDEEAEGDGLTGADGWKFEQPNEDIATAVFKVCDYGANMKKQWEEEKTEYSEHGYNGSLFNVLYNYSASTSVQYSPEEMEDLAECMYMNEDGSGDVGHETMIGCYKNDGGYWTVLLYHCVNMNGQKRFPEMNCYKYQNGKLDWDEAPLMTPELKKMLEDDNLTPYYYEGPQFMLAMAKLPSTDKIIYLKWNGKKFVPEMTENDDY